MPKPPTESEVTPLPENDRRQRRRFSAQDKQRILTEADACPERGQLGELLRREGIYSSHLGNWRAQLKRQGIEGLRPAKPGPKPKRDERDRLIEKQQRQLARLEKEVRIQRSLLEMQAKAHEILGIALPRVEDEEMAELQNSAVSASRRSH